MLKYCDFANVQERAKMVKIVETPLHAGVNPVVESLVGLFQGIFSDDAVFVQEGCEDGVILLVEFHFAGILEIMRTAHAVCTEGC